MDAYQNCLKAQIRSLDKIQHPDQNQFDDLAQLIVEAGRRAAHAAVPTAVRACQRVRPGVLGAEAAREVLAECLAACREAGESPQTANF